MALADRIAALAGQDDDPKKPKKGTPVVTVGAPVSVGTPKSELDRLANAPDLATRIATRLALLKQPSGYVTEGRESLPDRIASGVGEMAAAPAKSLLTTTLGALERGYTDPNGDQRAIPDKDYSEANAQTAANTAAAILSPMGAVPHIIGSAGVGAAYDTANPKRGAAIGAGIAAIPLVVRKGGQVIEHVADAAQNLIPSEPSRGVPRRQSPTLPAPLDPRVGPDLYPPSNAALAVRREVDAMARANRPAPALPQRARPVEAVPSEPAAFPNPSNRPPLTERERLAMSIPQERWDATDATGRPRVSDEQLAAAGGERFSGIGLPREAREGLRTAYRSALVTPYAEIEGAHPELANALSMAGAAPKRAEHIADRRLSFVLDGLTDDQKRVFGQKLVHDNLLAEAERKGATDPATGARFAAHAEAIAPHIPPGVENEPWFQRALADYKTHVEGPLTQDALASGVDPSSLRQPASAYVRLASEARLNDAEIRRALDVAGVKDVSELERRPRLLRKLIGENPALRDYFARNAEGPRQGPLQPGAGYPGEVSPVGGKRTQVSGSSKMAQGTAAEYSTDLSRIVNVDARDKAIKSARNRVWSEVAKVGRPLEPTEAPTPGKAVLSFTDSKGLATGDTGTLRYEVEPEVAAAVNKFHAGSQPQSAAFRGLKKAADLATRAQISGMPVEATSHANTLASIIASVPGEKDVTGKVLSAVPALGAKSAAIREMTTINFASPEIRALENRLADIGALRIEEPHGGLVNSAHRWLFGPEGVDVRGRLVLARKFLARDPNASDAALREFINGKLGNYISQNAGALPNFMAKGSVLSPFARFQSARIPTAVQTTLGQSGLPTNGTMQKLGDVANTLYRGPVGYGVGLSILNRLASGNGPRDNEAGHELDLNTGTVSEPGRIRRATAADADNPDAAVNYIPAATLNPVAYAGLRATGLRSALSPSIGEGDRVGSAVRDVANVALGTAGPFVRGAMTAVTGTQPYLQRDNSFIRVAPRSFSQNQELKDQVVTALGMANPALHAFSSSGGDAGRKLSGVLAEDGKPFGGPMSLAARIAEFTLPRVISPSIGGRTNEQSVDAQEARRYDEALQDIKRQLKTAPGPIARAEIIDRARRAAAGAGFDPDIVEVALQKSIEQDPSTVAQKRQRSVQKKLDKIRR